jgi:hypothetical protein
MLLRLDWSLPMRRRLKAAILIASGCVGSSEAAELAVPIHIQAGDRQAADCSTSRVTGLDPNGDNFLSVRSGPGGHFREVNRLHTGEVVTIYEAKGPWVGVVYRTWNPICSSRTTRLITYPHKGWVSRRYLADVAG